MIPESHSDVSQEAIAADGRVTGSSHDTTLAIALCERLLEEAERLFVPLQDTHRPPDIDYLTATEADEIEHERGEHEHIVAMSSWFDTTGMSVQLGILPNCDDAAVGLLEYPRQCFSPPASVGHLTDVGNNGNLLWILRPAAEDDLNPDFSRLISDASPLLRSIPLSVLTGCEHDQWDDWRQREGSTPWEIVVVRCLKHWQETRATGQMPETHIRANEDGEEQTAGTLFGAPVESSFRLRCAGAAYSLQYWEQELSTSGVRETIRHYRGHGGHNLVFRSPLSDSTEARLRRLRAIPPFTPDTPWALTTEVSASLFDVRNVLQDVLGCLRGDAPPDLISTTDAAKAAQVSEQTIRNRVNDGTIRGWWVGSDLRVSRGEIESKKDTMKRPTGAASHKVRPKVG